MANHIDHPALSEWCSATMAKELNRDMRETMVPFGDSELELSTMAPHTILAGATRSGKTTLIKGMMKAILPAPASEGGLKYRALIYDPKRELYPFLLAIGIPREQIIVTHPFDLRCTMWDLSADFKEQSQIRQLATALIPEEKSSGKTRQDFFESAARSTVYHVVNGLIQVLDDQWTLRDICEACATQDTIRAVMEKTRSGKEAYEKYYEETKQYEAKQSKGILGTLENQLDLETIGALWHRSPFKFSMERWHRSSGILLIGSDPQRSTTVDRLNRLLFQRSTELVRSREERPTDLTWYVMDEIREGLRLPNLRKLLTAGASKGVRMIMGFQDMNGMEDVWGEKAAAEMVGQCGNKILLRFNNPKSAKWASDLFGETEEWIYTYGSSSSATYAQNSKTTSYSQNRSQQIGMRVKALPIEFMDFPEANLDNGIYGWHSIATNQSRFHVSPDDMEDFLCLNTLPSDNEYLERPPEHQSRIPWTNEECDRFDVKSMQEHDNDEEIADFDLDF